MVEDAVITLYIHLLDLYRELFGYLSRNLSQRAAAI